MRGLQWLVAGQTGLAALLLVGAALFARSLQKLTAVDPGLDPRSRASVNLSLPAGRYPDAGSMMAFYDGLQQRAELLGGVARATLVRNLPLRDNQRNENLLREGETTREHAVPVSVQLGGRGVLRTLGIPLIDGRDFDASDRVGAVRVALVNRSAAKTLWPNESPIGKRVTATFAPPTYGLITIVGVYGDVRSGGLSATPADVQPFVRKRAAHAVENAAGNEIADGSFHHPPGGGGGEEDRTRESNRDDVLD